MGNFFKRLRALWALSFLTFGCINSALAQCTGLADFSSPLIYTSATATTVSLSWGTASGRDYYKVYAGGVQFGANITGNSLTVNGLSAGQTYSFFVEAIKECLKAGEPDQSSVTSNTITVTTVPPTPSNLQVTSTSITSSSFLVTWDATSGAGSYQLDVSATPTFVSFNSFNVNQPATQIPVNSGLLAGTKYYLRLKAINVNGSSGYTNSSATTILDPPALTIPASTITSTSIVIKWDAMPQASGYRIDISEDDQFGPGNFFADYENKLVTGTSLTVDNLNPESTYYARMRTEKNSPTPVLTSVNSNSAQSLTRTLAPAIESISSIKSTSFKASWDLKPTATEYRVDVSLDDAFNNMLAAYNNLLVNGSTLTVIGLSPGSTYHFRVRAINPTGPSLNSDHQSILTAPATPLVFDKSNITSTGFTVNWTSVPTATEYDLFIYRDQNFSEPVDGYSPLVVQNPTVTVNVSGLSPSTTYFIRLRVRNAAEKPDSGSDFVTITATTPALGAGNTTPSFKNTTFPSSFMADEKKVISTEVTGGIGSLSVRLYHKSISEENYTREDISSSASVYSVEINKQWFDDFGMEFYWEVEDANQAQREAPRTIALATSNVRVPISSFGASEENYHIIAIPYVIDEDNHINNAFEKVLGAYNKKKWRFSRFSNDKIVEYENGLSANLLGQGLGYWFISKEEVTLDLGKGVSHAISKVNPFKMKLTTGWNQIGNPFPYDLSWSDVLSANDSPTIVSELYTYSNGTFAESNLLKAFSGGFVFAEADMELIFPVSLQHVSGGRKKTNSPTAPQILPNWFLPITVTQGAISNHISGVGMNEEAKEGKDKFDVVTLPKFYRYLNFSSRSGSFSYELSTNIVNPQDSYVWRYNVNCSSAEAIKLNWDNRLVNELRASLVLHDETNHQIVNMAEVDEYHLTPDSRISIHYSKSIVATEPSLALGNLYPNPFTTIATIPVDFSMIEPTQVSLVITDLNGRVIWKDQQVLNERGVRNIIWDGTTLTGEEVPPGFYMYTLSGMTGEREFIYRGKIIKN